MSTFHTDCWMISYSNGRRSWKRCSFKWNSQDGWFLRPPTSWFYFFRATKFECKWRHLRKIGAKLSLVVENYGSGWNSNWVRFRAFVAMKIVEKLLKIDFSRRSPQNNSSSTQDDNFFQRYLNSGWKSFLANKTFMEPCIYIPSSLEWRGKAQKMMENHWIMPSSLPNTHTVCLL